MKKSAGGIFVKGLLRSFIIFALLFGTAAFSYRTAMRYFDIENGETEAMAVIPPEAAQHDDEKNESLTTAKIDDISKHLIFCIDENDGSIKKLVLEIFNCAAHKLCYITIPVKTQLTLSQSLHKELILMKPYFPQFLQISAITSYISGDAAYEYGVLMIEDLLNVSISYYSVVPESLYNTVFATEKIGNDAADVSPSNAKENYPAEIFSQDFLDFLHTIKTETQLREYIKEIYGRIKSNLPYEDKLNYMESYLNTSGENISFEVIAGKNSNSAYIIDKDAAERQLKECMAE